MHRLGLPLLFAAPAGDAAAGGAAGGVIQFLPFVLIIAIFYFLIIRPQNKKQKETQKMLEALKKGDKVVTIGGIHGTISSVKEKTVMVRVDDDTKLEFSRSAISQVSDPAKEIEAAKGSSGDDASEKKAEKIEDKASTGKSADKTES